MPGIKNGRLGLYGAEHSKCNHLMTLGFKGKLKEHKEKAVLHMNVGLVGTGADTRATVWLPSQSQSINTLWSGPNYIAWWQKHCM